MSLVSICHLHIACNSHFGGLCSLQMASMASEVTFNLRFEIPNLNYPDIHMHVAPNSHFVGLRGYGGLKTASEVTSHLGIELSDLNYICCHAFLASKCL